MQQKMVATLNHATTATGPSWPEGESDEPDCEGAASTAALCPGGMRTSNVKANITVMENTAKITYASRHPNALSLSVLVSG